jgi:hypothetical protein
MNGMPAAFNAAMGALGAADDGDSPGGFLMLDSGAGAAWLRMESVGGEPRTARVSRWLAVVRVGRGAGQVPATRVIWLLDIGSAAWPGGRPPAGLAGYQERHGLNLTGQGTQESLVLWFHARGGRGAPCRKAPRPPRRLPRRGAARRPVPHRPLAARLSALPLAASRWLRAAVRRARAPWAFTAVGVLGAAGIVDGASTRVSRWPLGTRLGLRAAVDAGDWGLAGASLFDVNGEPLYTARLTIAAAGRPRDLDLPALREWL